MPFTNISFRENSFFGNPFRDPRISPDFQKKAQATLLALACHPAMWGPLVPNVVLGPRRAR